MAKKRAVLVHGWQGNPHDSWKSWMGQELKKRKIEWIAPQFPQDNAPKLDEWIAVLRNSVISPDKKTYFIGHSLGCIAILKYLEKLPEHVKVGGCVFVAGFCSDLGEGFSDISSFTAQPLDKNKVNSHCTAFAVIGSRDDPKVPFAKVLELQHILRAKLIIDDGKGHFSSGTSNIQELPSARDALLKLIQHGT